ncbi:MAG: 3'(2'),5'-bisphosphate nucleotidase [bacterium]
MVGSYKEEKNIAMRAVSSAADICRRIRLDMVRPESIRKGDRSPVTVADYASQAIICKMLSDALPADPIVAEEDSKALRMNKNSQILNSVTDYVRLVFPNASPEDVCDWIDRGMGDVVDRFWALDPIDGTKGFLRGGQYALALALIEGGEVRLGAMACPNLTSISESLNFPRGSLFLAAMEGGAEALEIEGRRSRAIRVSSVADPSEARLIESYESEHVDRESHILVARGLNISRPPIRMDSQAKYGVVAGGGADIYLRIPPRNDPGRRENIWDHAAGILIVEEAGGEVSDIFGRPIEFTWGRRLAVNIGLVVTNSHLHRTVLNSIESIDAETLSELRRDHQPLR